MVKSVMESFGLSNLNIGRVAPHSSRGSSPETQNLLDTGWTGESYGSRGVTSQTNNTDDLGQDGVTLTWRDLNVDVPQSRRSICARCCLSSQAPLKRVLHGVHGAVGPGSLVAVMGPSGSGKSTLMTSLALRRPGEVRLEGNISYNGRTVDSSMLHLTGFVYQDDMFVGSLTVREHLEFVARLKLDRCTSAVDRSSRVDNILQTVGLKKAQHTRIGCPGSDKSLSGGERKRLAFASEVITDPPLLFCDEPTTGLDSYNAERIVSTLRELAGRGKTVLCTIHQPSSTLFSMFDRLLLLSQGRVAFTGAAAEAADFFSQLNYPCPTTYNPADHYVHCLAVAPGREAQSLERVHTICDAFDASQYAAKLDDVTRQNGVTCLSASNGNDKYDRLIEKKALKLSKERSVGWMVQFYWLMWRAFLDSIRNPAVHGVRIAQKLLTAVMAGLCYSNLSVDQAGIQNIQGLMFILVTENTFPALYGVLNLFPQELPLFLRESKSRMYSTSGYYISRVISLVPGFIIDPVLFVGIILVLTPIRHDWVSVLGMLAVAVATCNTAAACGCMFSAAFENVPLASALLIPFDYLLMITGGVFLKLSRMPAWLAWIKSLSWFKYGNEAFSIVQWRDVVDIPCSLSSNATLTACVQTGEEVLERYTFASSHLLTDFMGMLLLFAGFHTLGLMALWCRSRHK